MITRFRSPLGMLLALVALCGAALACSLSGQEVVVVTATASPRAGAGLVPTIPVITAISSTNNSSPAKVATAITPPTITPIPSATPAANVALGQADSSLRNGDYDSAVTTYQSVLARPALSVDPKLRADASIGLGTADLRAGNFADAVTALSDFITAYSSDSRVPQAYFSRGDALLGLSRWQDAIADFQVYLQKRPGLIDSYAYERIGDAYLALKTMDQTLANYTQAVNAARGLAPLLALREKVAAAYLNSGDSQSALGQYDAILAAAKLPDYRAGIAWTAAALVAKSGDLKGAYQRYQEIITDYPETPEGYRAMQALLASGAPVDPLLHGKISFAAKDYADAITALYAYTGITPIPQIDPEVYMSLGQAYREVGNNAAANTSFQAVIDQYPTSTQYGDAWLEQGRTLYLAGKVQDAIDKYKQLATDHPDVPQGAEGLWRAGYLYSTLGNTESSLANFEILGNKYPGTSWAMDGLFRGGMAAYNQHDNPRAQRFFSLLANTGTGDLKAAGYLWLGRLYQISNQQQLARDAYTEASKADPGGYYSLRAADLLAGHGPFVPPGALDLAFNDPAHIAEAETWMRTTFKITQTGDLWPLSPALSADTRMIRGSELWAVAAYDDAKGEFDALTADNEQNPLALYQLASYYFRIGLYPEAINATAKMLDNANIQTVDAPKAIAALRFPIAYYDLVLPAAQKYNVDPLLIFSMIRQESLFEGTATSSQAAQGLMQIIPDTGAYIAQKVNWPNYQNADIYKPYINVPFGVYYVREQLDTFDGNTYAALAAYNAGPGASSEWFKISNGDPDLFLQAIDFDQTQMYVRRIFEQYEVYTKIYGGK